MRSLRHLNTKNELQSSGFIAVSTAAIQDQTLGVRVKGKFDRTQSTLSFLRCTHTYHDARKQPAVTSLESLGGLRLIAISALLVVHQSYSVRRKGPHQRYRLALL